MRIAVLGCGKMGAWLAPLLAKENEVAAFDTNESKTKGLAKVKPLASLDALAKFSPNILINAVSLQNTISAYESTLRFLPKDCVLCDIASVKEGLPEYYPKAGFRFASVHPMFGPTFASMGALKGENAIIIKESDHEAQKFFRGFFRKLGLNIHEYSFREHDEMMAYSLTTPFVSSLVFAACIDKVSVPGTTFRKHLGIADGLLMEDNTLLSEILFNVHTIKQIDKINSRLELLKHIIMAKDRPELENFLDRLRNNIRQEKSMSVEK